ncbi:hypothetical protein [Hydrogenophaga sp. 2FB]|uniref:hypothetical protein n=1 Tax=Hydrogenophaga sp. 2FB TaxID=2502187 RepID=UPI0010F8F701|nr:hypothetical protein [Hydrogenophaga sp. 2FB]
MTTVHQFFNAVLGKQPVAKTGPKSGQPGVADVPAVERRSARSVVRHTVARFVEIVTAGSSRTNKAGRAAQQQEKAALNVADQALGNVIKLALSKRPATAMMACEKVTHALNSIPPKTTNPSDSAAQLRGALVLKQLAALTVAELATLKDVLAQCQQPSSDPDIQQLNGRVQSDPVMQQLDMSVKSEALRHQLVHLNLEGEARWAVRPVTLWATDKAMLVGLKDVRDLASSLIDQAQKSDSDDTVLPGTHYKLGALKDFKDYGDTVVNELKSRAIKSLERVSPQALQAMEGPELKALKEDVDFLLENPVKNVDTVHVQGLKNDVLSHIKANEIKTTESLLGKGPFNVQRQDAAKLATMAEDIARLKDKPLAVADAEQAIAAAVDKRKQDAESAFKASLRTAVRQARAANGAQALMDFLTKAQAAERLFSALKTPLGTTESTQWIQAVLHEELGHGPIGESQLKTLQKSLNAGAGKRIRDHLSAQNDGSVGPAIQLTNALGAMFPEGGSPPAKRA